MVGHGGSSACLYLADLTSPIPSHCASIVATSTVRVKMLPLHLHLYGLFACFYIQYFGFQSTLNRIQARVSEQDEQWYPFLDRFTYETVSRLCIFPMCFGDCSVGKCLSACQVVCTHHGFVEHCFIRIISHSLEHG